MACPACDSPTRCVGIDARNDADPVYSPSGHLRGYAGRHGTTFVYRLVCRNGCETTVQTHQQRDDFIAEMRGEREPFVRGERHISAMIPFDEPVRPKKPPGPTDADRKRGEHELERLGSAVEELEEP